MFVPFINNNFRKYYFFVYYKIAHSATLQLAVPYTYTEKRKKLDSAIAYLSKDEQHIDSLSDKKEKSFVRGTLPKSKGNMGRPRKESKK